MTKSAITSASTEFLRPAQRLSTRRVVGGIPAWCWALGFYLAMAIVTIGWHAIKHPRTVCACVGTEDPATYMWALSWWPHAIAHGLNPFVSHYLWSPTGVNVAKAAVIPTAAIAMTPITELAGPIASYNVLAIASPALSAFTAYLLCRRIVRRQLAAAAGGYLFGFSAYEFAQLMGHLNLTLVFLIPVAVHVTLRRVDDEISRPVYVAAIALLFVLQAGLSTELLAECLGLAAVMMAAAYYMSKESFRSRIVGASVDVVIAGLIATIILSPFLYYALFSESFPKGAGFLSDAYPLDLLNLVFPTYTTWLGHHDFLSLGLTFDQGNVAEANGYLSVAIIVAFMLWLASEGMGTMLGRLLLVAVVLSVVMALGSHLYVAGHQTISLPFNWVRTWPVFNDIVPSRTVLFAVLAVSIGVASWLANAQRHVIVRWLVVVAGIALTFPNLISSLYGVPPHNPTFFATNMYRKYIARDATVLMLPFGQQDVSTLWQGETGFQFYMPEGYVSDVVPSPFNSEITVALGKYPSISA